MKTTLYKLKEGYVLCSNEKIKHNEIGICGDWVQYFRDRWDEKDWKKLIASTFIKDLSKIDFSLLSEEDAKRVGWFDVDREAASYLDANYNLSYERTTWQRLHEKTYKEGFQKALELTADRRFSFDYFELGDLIRVAFLKHGHDSWASIAKDVIQSLSQTKSWEVEYKEENGVYKIIKIIS